ncbi:uncharacterized protein LOC142357174 [Convolutriloba macropyga]|uniref:uncharacterized protein LOC142357174 n=1 Tax=Convolutriloba macropyga TaxID=536237 RepID=UPI003F5275EB
MIRSASITMKTIPSSWTIEELLVYFVAIQQGGVKMKGSELILAMNHGPFTRLVEELAQTKEVQDIWPDPKNRPEPKDMRPQELLMRFFTAEHVGHEEYGGQRRSLPGSSRTPSPSRTKSGPPVRPAGDCPGPFRKAARAGKGKRWAAANPAKTVNNNVFDFQMYVCSHKAFNREFLHKHRKEIFDLMMRLQQSDPAFASLSHSGHCERVLRCRQELTSLIEKSEAMSKSEGPPAQPADGPRSFTDQDKRMLFDRMANDGKLVCNLCGEALPQDYDSEELHMDHIVPFSKGGPTVPDNAQLVHRLCNLRKGSKVRNWEL